MVLTHSPSSPPSSSSSSSSCSDQPCRHHSQQGPQLANTQPLYTAPPLLRLHVGLLPLLPDGVRDLLLNTKLPTDLSLPTLPPPGLQLSHLRCQLITSLPSKLLSLPHPITDFFHCIVMIFNLLDELQAELLKEPSSEGLDPEGRSLFLKLLQ